MSKYHLIGIGGVGMSALAHILLDRRSQVSGSDRSWNAQVARLHQRGADIAQGHQKERVQADYTVVYSSDIQHDNPEYLEAQRLDCPLWHRSELLAHLIEGSTSIAVAGSHGKTTTTGWATHLLQKAGRDPSFAIGGLFQGANGYLGKGEWFVFEADESDGSWMRYQPDYAILTNLGKEHLNHYGSFEALQEAAQQFAHQVKRQLIYCVDDPNIHVTGIRYGFHHSAEYRIIDVQQEGFQQTVTVRVYNQEEYRYTIQLLGRHNVLNSTAIFALGHQLAIPIEVIVDALASYTGVGRRMERKGSHPFLLQFDDYGHHPTEIRTTLAGCKAAVADRRLVVLFQPHRYSRMEALWDEYLEAFHAADQLFVTDIYAASENPRPGISGEALAAAIAQVSRVPVQYLPKTQWAELSSFLLPHDVFLTVGAGDVDQAHQYVTGHRKLRIGLCYGGRSCEHEISCRTAQFIRNALHPLLYEVVPLFIDREGVWHLEDPSGHSVVQSPEEILSVLRTCDLAFPALHGTWGEDGTIQGYFEMIHLPYVGCDWVSCAVMMNKMHAKRLVASIGIPVAPALIWSQQEWQHHSEEWKQKVVDQLRFPLFVKPNHLGSSVGVSKIHHIDELPAAVERVFQVDTLVLVEQGIEQARECEFAVIGNSDRGMCTVSFPAERLTGGHMMTYDMKYSSQPCPVTTTPAFDPEILALGRTRAQQVFHVLGGMGLSRIDFLLDREGVWWFLEANPMPGMTATSTFPKMCSDIGLGPSALMDRCIILALDRDRRRKRTIRPCIV